MRYVAPTVMCCWLRKSMRLFEQRSRRRHITVAVLAIAQPHRQSWFEPIDLQKVGKLSNQKSEDRVWALQVGSRAIFLCGAHKPHELACRASMSHTPHAFTQLSPTKSVPALDSQHTRLPARSRPIHRKPCSCIKFTGETRMSACFAKVSMH
jgi:hypothetical protein